MEYVNDSECYECFETDPEHDAASLENPTGL